MQNKTFERKLKIVGRDWFISSFHLLLTANLKLDDKNFVNRLVAAEILNKMKTAFLLKKQIRISCILFLVFLYSGILSIEQEIVESRFFAVFFYRRFISG